MPYLEDEQEIYSLYKESKQESDQWREDYHEFERLADNDLIEDLDPTLPEVNDGTLSAALFKLPKRIVNSNLKGRAKALDRDEAWLSELANLQWENEIIPNANSQAPFHRKWKDAVRKAAIYGSVPLITLLVDRGDYIGTDFIVAQPQDVKLEPGKVSDYDSDVVFWDVYYSKLQAKQMLETAKKEVAEAKESGSDGYNKWDIEALQEIVDAAELEERETDDDHKTSQDKSVRRKGIKFCVVFQRGVDAPFYMFHPKSQKKVREWTNQDPTGDIPVHFLYCYQDFVNPYGIGIVKLAGGTQNALDYFRQADILATQLGFRPPVSISGETEGLDLDSIVYEQDAQWLIGQASIKREEISNQIYQALPNRMSMYKISLNQLIPTGDTSISSGSGDQDYSKTPAGVKFQQQNLSIDDEDFKDNLYMTYEAVAKSMINIKFANMQGTDLMKLSDEERELLIKGGMDWPVDDTGAPIETNELEILWDEVRATFNFEMEAEQDKAKDDEKRLDSLLKIVELRASDPTLEQSLLMAGKRLNLGELFSSIIQLTTDNDKILEPVTPEEQEEMAAAGEVTEEAGAEAQNPEDAQEMANIQAIMQEHQVPENVAMAMREAEVLGTDDEGIEMLKDMLLRDMEEANV